MRPPTRRPAVLFYPLVESLLEADEDSSAMLDEFRNWLLIHGEDGSQPRLPIDFGSHGVSPSEPQGSENDSRPVFPKDVDSYIRSIFERAAVFGRYAEREIGRCFGVDKMSPLVRRPSSGAGAKVELSIPRKSVAGTVRYLLRLHSGGVEFSAEIGGLQSLSHEIEPDRVRQLGTPEGISFHIRRLAPRLGLTPESIDDYEDLRFWLSSLVEDIFRSLLRPLYRNAYYLPADRTGIMHGHQVVVSALVQSATTAGLRPSADIPILSGVLADFLSQLIEMRAGRGGIRSRSRRASSSSSDKLAERLEHEVLKGTVRLERAESGYPRFEYRPEGWDENLPLMRASSMVSELAPVVLYLRHLVRPGDILIIEEPESHLHPAMQAEFTRQLAAVVRAGIRVIVTTHSEWLLEELANLVRLSQVPEAERKGIAGGDVALDANQVGAWLFKPDEFGGGSTVREIDLDESGLYPSGFEEVATALHNRWAAISSRLGEDE